MKHAAILCTALFLSVVTLSADERVDYATQIKPLLATKCFACHGALKQESGLRMDAALLIRKGGDSGVVVVAGKANESLLIEKVLATDIDQRMPPEGEGEALTAEQVVLLKQWIDQGAVAPDESIPPDPRKHWAYQPPKRPDVPKPKSSAGAGSSLRNDVDAFLAAEHEERGLTPAPPAAKEVLLRRLYLDLVGLPPARKELHAFLADESPQAYQRVVNRLLDSPQYGERWGRHWMDVWRYSDWAGFGNEIRYSQRHIWRWRDWIIESLNADKGYDRMILEMLAADELAPKDDDAIRATGFLARNWYKFDRNVWLDDVVEHTGKAFLGTTFKCARCHDHKYDPLSQKEYYRLRAIFEPYDVRTDRAPGELDVNKNGLARVYDAKLDAATYFFERGDPKRADKEHPVSPGVPAVLGGEFKMQPVTLPLQGYYPAMREFVARDMIAAAEASVKSAEAELVAAKEQLEKSRSLALPNRASSEKDSALESQASVFLNDDFAKARADVWKPIRGQWEYADGRLLQKQIVGAFSPMTTVKNHPRDFSATLDFKPTGGSVYRSVGFSFDWIEDRDFQAVYLSAKNGGSTVSAFHRRAGTDTYPPQAVVPHAIKVGQRVKLEVLVRGDVLNLKVDDQLKLAYRLPVDRQSGKFAIWTYDASAEFFHVRVSELPADVKLAPPSVGAVAKSKTADPKLSRKTAEQAVSLAEKKIAVGKAKVIAIKTRVDAERAKHKVGQVANLPNSETLMKEAAKAERHAALAAANEKLLAANHELDRAKDAADKSNDDKSKQVVAAAEKKVAAAQKTFDTAKEAAEQDSSSYSPLGPTYPQTSTGRRLALARWIADRRNPLTARVAVNHIWLRHFGRPLVESVDDFGLRSPRPPLADLLDYLAVELMEHNWSMKHVHQLIVTSRAYRMSSSVGRIANPSHERDPDNKLFWKFNPRRMEAEMVRDAVLQMGGSLDLARGGPDIDYKQGLTIPRRSLYFRHARERQMEFLRMFDPANPRECYRRQESIRPQQAFAMVNSSLSLAQSRKLAGRLAEEERNGEPTDDDSFVVAAFETVLSRKPNEAELSECRRFLDLQAQQLADSAKLELLGNATNAIPPSSDPVQRARENLVLVLLNHNDFVTVR